MQHDHLHHYWLFCLSARMEAGPWCQRAEMGCWEILKGHTLLGFILKCMGMVMAFYMKEWRRNLQFRRSPAFSEKAESRKCSPPMTKFFSSALTRNWFSTKALAPCPSPLPNPHQTQSNGSSRTNWMKTNWLSWILGNGPKALMRMLPRLILTGGGGSCPQRHREEGWGALFWVGKALVCHGWLVHSSKVGWTSWLT